MEIIREERLEDSFAKAARRIVEWLQQQEAQRPLCVGLCGGRSVGGLLDALRQAFAGCGAELLRSLHFFVIDERLVPFTSDESNFRLLHERFFRHLVEDGVISPSQVHPFEPDNGQADYGCAVYFSELAALGGEFSVVVLGMGEDGHVAGLFPGHEVLGRAERGFAVFHDSPKPPPGRMTATRGLVTSAGLGVLLALGEGKRKAWNAFCDPSVSERECPAKMVGAIREGVVVTDL